MQIPHAEILALVARCTQEARQAFAHCAREANARGARSCTLEHLLLGLCHEEVEARATLAEGRLPLAALKERLDRAVGRRHDLALPGFECEPETWCALSRAGQEAGALGHALIRSGHFLLGILAQPETPAGRLLQEAGISADRVRARLCANAAGCDASE
jgi:ATP-dependent Clp protease ATP-binding subunit ClpA